MDKKSRFSKKDRIVILLSLASVLVLGYIMWDSSRKQQQEQEMLFRETHLPFPVVWIRQAQQSISSVESIRQEWMMLPQQQSTVQYRARSEPSPVVWLPHRVV